MRGTRIGARRTLAALLVFVAACGGCREYCSYLRLTPPSEEWTHDAQDFPEEYVWRTEGATARAWSDAAIQPFQCGDSTEMARDVTLRVVVTNEGPGPLDVTVACGAGDADAKYYAFVPAGQDAEGRLPPRGLVAPFSAQSFTIAPPAPGSSANSRTITLEDEVVEGKTLPPPRSFPLDLTLRRGETETHCAACFLAQGSGRVCHWYSFPLDAVCCVWVVAFNPSALL